ncbi:MAG: DASH family cryptochrome [Planctomycetota bacterium]
MPAPPPTLLWFRRQLRLDDQPLFASPDEPIAGVWVLDPRELLTTDPLGFPRCGDRRLRFILESVADLRRSLAERGVDLVVRTGEPETVLPKLVRESGAGVLRLVEEPGTEERTIEKKLRRAFDDDPSLGQLDLLPPESLHGLDDPRAEARQLPEVFSKWRRRAEKKLELARPRDTPGRLTAWTDHGLDPGDLPTLADLGRDEPRPDPRAVLDFRGGEAAGRQRVNDYIFDGDHLRRYKETRNGLLGADYSSKFSPWLALGCVSARRVADETLRYEDRRVANDSTYWLRFELLWREYFRLYLLKHGPRLFRAAGPADRDLGWANPANHFAAWRDAETSVPFVDANMTELSASGFMSNRGRQNVASFLAKNLDVDWRRGARWFESCLLDYDPASNWGNWAYAAGVGADPRGFRGFDVVGQGRRYDPDAAYIRHWLGDRLAAYPDADPHTPWTGGGPLPLVDPRRSLAAAEERWDAR